MSSPFPSALPSESDPNSRQPRSGYTLPVFACAAAIAALRWLTESLATLDSVVVELIEPAIAPSIPIEQVARLSANTALAITRSDPGDNLDLTRDTPIWATVTLGDSGFLTLDGENPAIVIEFESTRIQLRGGEGIGKLINADLQPAIYRYAQQLFQHNLMPRLTPGQTVDITLILPEGRALAERTSNAAFGVVEGLSLLGSSGISQPLSAPGQLEAFRETLRQAAQTQDWVVFCVGENGLDYAQRLGIPSDRLIKTANWLGPMLVEAAEQGIRSILLFGYHGKLIKLAGGIFHTHHSVADGRQAILAAFSANAGLAHLDVQQVFASLTAEAALAHLRKLDQETQSQWVSTIYGAIAQQIDQRSERYIQDHTNRHVKVGCVLFDRNRKILIQSATGATFLSQDLLS